MTADAEGGGVYADGGDVYAEGDHVLLVDRKKRRYLVTLAAGAEFHSHTGVIAHDDLLGCDEGTSIRSSRGSYFVTFRPTLSDFILKMPRGAQVIYPKDLGAILMIADLQPGLRVFESGIGSGALSMTMLRAGVEIIGYEVREDFAAKASANVAAVLDAEALSRYRVEIRSAYDGIDEEGLDRVILDLPEPWQVVPHAATSLKLGGIAVAYTPSIVQASKVRRAFDDHGFGFAETVEVLHRTWHVDGDAVRPDHRMVAHTAFLSSARFLGRERRAEDDAENDESGG